mmetsp:Transcript_42834/g.103442  ORF Transcript_42834/g.103442 Transcript_42834/m.103442 type:complete len:247 (+) Transcript_42834:808-1548(+)
MSAVTLGVLFFSAERFRAFNSCSNSRIRFLSALVASSPSSSTLPLSSSSESVTVDVKDGVGSTMAILWIVCCISLTCASNNWLSRCNFAASSAEMLLTTFRVAVFLIFRALVAYRKVLIVSSILKSAGLTHATMIVRELPPKESCNNLVNLESRYGGFRLYLGRCSASAETTCPRTNSPLLMLIPSFLLPPSAPVFLIRSLPARSTRVNLDWNLVLSSNTPWTLRTQIAWDRELTAFIFVLATTRR